MNRRKFVGMGLAGAAMTRLPGRASRPDAGRSLAIVIDPADPVATSVAVRTAVRSLEQQLAHAGVETHTVARLDDVGRSERAIIVCGTTRSLATSAFAHARVAPPAGAEALALIPATLSGRRVLVASGVDARGLSYAILELADRVRFSDNGLASLDVPRAIVERPVTPVRSVMRQFTSEPLDKPWFYDRDGWTSYLSMLATHRFNRLNLTFGLGYDSLSRVADSYFVFMYPFLVAVPGFDVRASNLSDAERDRNLETLRFISDETVAHGLEFELGLWMHGYQMPNSPAARYVIQGLTPESHAPYCRDALTTVLKACPSISSVGLRIHGESGIAEGSYDFWETIFTGVPRAGRTVEIDLHAKGIDATMIARAAKTGMPINLSPKFAAEHCGMPYHQAAIRELEMPVAGHTGAGLMTLSEGSRVFTRYGYADLLRNNRTYTVRTRVFAGTQRILASGDPAWAASYARAFTFDGMTGADLMEPLTCRGRRGTGHGRRDGYADAGLAPQYDWEKYARWYRCMGRAMYDPATPAAVYQRDPGRDARSLALSSALAYASRILPVITNAHLPSAACDAYWPEIYWNQPMVGEGVGNPYTDSPSPRNFQHVSALDPQLFSTITEHAAELVAGRHDARYSPVDVAQWLDELASAAVRELGKAGAPTTSDARRLSADVKVQAGLGRFFAAKFRSAVAFALFESTGDTNARTHALMDYKRARAFWAELAGGQRGIYQADLSVSDKVSEHGQWLDRVALLDEDIAAMSQKLADAPARDAQIGSALARVAGASRRTPAACIHVPSSQFTAGKDVELRLVARNGTVASVRLCYRHVSQAERWVSVDMTLSNGAYVAAIPSAYAASPYSLQYYFVVTDSAGHGAMYPGFGPELDGQPYFLTRRA